MFGTARSRRGAVGVEELAGMGAPHFRQNAIQGLYAGRAFGLGQRRSNEPGGQKSCQKKNARAHRRFLAFFK